MAALRDHIIDFLINKLSSFRSNRKKAKSSFFNSQEESLFDKHGIYQYVDARNTKINLFNDSVISNAILDGFEENELNFVYRYLQKDDVFLDIGSNIGLFSLTAAKKIRNGQIFAFEPSPTTHERLIKNIRLNNVGGLIAPLNIALSSKSDTLDFYLSLDGFDAWNGFTLPQVGSHFKRLKIACSTLDIFCEEQNVSKIDLIKIDVEGWEYPVLLGATEVIRKFSPDFLIEFTEENARSAGFKCTEIYNLLEKSGYEWYEMDTDLNLKPAERKEYFDYCNLLATKDLETVKKRLTPEK